MGFNGIHTEQCVFVKNHKNQTTFLLLYVDDFIVASTCKKDLEQTKAKLKETYKMTDDGEISEFLHMKIIYHRSKGTICFSQQKYTKELLDEYLEDYNIKRSTPMVENWDKIKKTSDTSKSLPKDNKYRQITGKLIYLANLTRPDITHAVSILCGKNYAPTERDLAGAQHLLQYLNNTKYYSLTTGGAPSAPIVFTDASYKRCQDTSRSHSGYVIMYGQGAVVWQSLKQKLVASSTCHAEYYALRLTCARILWIRHLFEELGMTILDPTVVYEDNEATRKVALNNTNSKGTLDIHPYYHRSRELLAEKIIEIKYIPSADNIADLLTKPTSKTTLGELRPRIGVRHSLNTKDNNVKGELAKG